MANLINALTRFVGFMVAFFFMLPAAACGILEIIFQRTFIFILWLSGNEKLAETAWKTKVYVYGEDNDNDKGSSGGSIGPPAAA